MGILQEKHRIFQLVFTHGFCFVLFFLRDRKIESISKHCEVARVMFSYLREYLCSELSACNQLSKDAEWFV